MESFSQAKSTGTARLSLQTTKHTEDIVLKPRSMTLASVETTFDPSPGHGHAQSPSFGSNGLSTITPNTTWGRTRADAWAPLKPKTAQPVNPILTPLNTCLRAQLVAKDTTGLPAGPVSASITTILHDSPSDASSATVIDPIPANDIKAADTDADLSNDKVIRRYLCAEKAMIDMIVQDADRYSKVWKARHCIVVGGQYVIMQFDDTRQVPQALGQLQQHNIDNGTNHGCYSLTVAEYNAIANPDDHQPLMDELEGFAHVVVTSLYAPVHTDRLRAAAVAEVQTYGHLEKVEVFGPPPVMTSVLGLTIQFSSVFQAAEFNKQFREPVIGFKTRTINIVAVAKNKLAETITISALAIAQAERNIAQLSVAGQRVRPRIQPAHATNLASMMSGLNMQTPTRASRQPSEPHGLALAGLFTPPSGNMPGSAYLGSQSDAMVMYNTMPPAYNCNGSPHTNSFVTTPSVYAQAYGDRIQGNSNPVDVARILRGEDVRTTVMLRNVPNKLSMHELKSIIDTHSFGRYDFSYLRIDFKNGLNVGYAFINFVKPVYIADFTVAMEGRRWNMYNSDKLAGVSYATKQGLNCLIDTFRNSSVMEEHPDHRPKLWVSEIDGGPLLGYERPWPVPDNNIKLQRSRDNKANNGLFAARTNQRPPLPHVQYNRNAQPLMLTGVGSTFFAPAPAYNSGHHQIIAGDFTNYDLVDLNALEHMAQAGNY